jgi:hypothetical protein
VYTCDEAARGPKTFLNIFCKLLQQNEPSPAWFQYQLTLRAGPSTSPSPQKDRPFVRRGLVQTPLQYVEIGNILSRKEGPEHKGGLILEQGQKYPWGLLPTFQKLQK